MPLVSVRRTVGDSCADGWVLAEPTVRDRPSARAVNRHLKKTSKPRQNNEGPLTHRPLRLGCPARTEGCVPGRSRFWRTRDARRSRCACYHGSGRPPPVVLSLLPAIQAHVRSALGYLRSEHDREEAEAEVVPRAWERFAADRLAVTPSPSPARSWPGPTVDSPSDVSHSPPRRPNMKLVRPDADTTREKFAAGPPGAVGRPDRAGRGGGPRPDRPGGRRARPAGRPARVRQEPAARLGPGLDRRQEVLHPADQVHHPGGGGRPGQPRPRSRRTGSCG